MNNNLDRTDYDVNEIEVEPRFKRCAKEAAVVQGINPRDSPARLKIACANSNQEASPSQEP